MRIQTASDPIVLDDDLVVAGENAAVLDRLPEGAFDLIYMDPPFNTGRAQTRRSLSVVVDDVDGDRVGSPESDGRTSWVLALRRALTTHSDRP